VQNGTLRLLCAQATRFKAIEEKGKTSVGHDTGLREGTLAAQMPSTGFPGFHILFGPEDARGSLVFRPAEPVSEEWRDGEKPSIPIAKNFTVSNTMLDQRNPCFLEGFFGDDPNTWIAYLSMRAWIQDKQDIIPCLLLKFKIAPAFALRIATLHFDEAVHGFANVLDMARIGNFRSIFKEGVIVAHL
jgi:hypothetical protein